MRSRRELLAAAALLVAAPALPPSRPARAEDVELALVLAVDASGSVTPERFELQKQGYVHAFRDRRLLNAILGTPSGAIAVCMTQWTGPAMQLEVVPWQVIRAAAGAAAFADAIAAAPRQLFGGGTSISGAILHAAGLIATGPHAAQRRVIDISGDGANNRGRPSDEARDGAVAAGITINGLPILAVEPDLAEFYRDHVIGGPGAFLIVAESYDQFAAAVLRKLILEISARPDPRFGGSYPPGRFGGSYIDQRSA